MHLLSALRRSDTLRSFTGLWLAAFLAFGPALSAAIRTVDDNGPADYPSITAALAAANAGDTIQVAAGTYNETIEDFPLALKDGVAVVGAGRATTFITPDAGTPAFDNENTALGPTTRLEGFTLTHPAGQNDPLMFFILGTAAMSPVITDNAFIGNDDEDDGGIFIGGSSEGGSFTGSITDTDFTGFVGASSSGPQAQIAPASSFNGGGIIMTILPPETSAAKKRGRLATNAALPGEDNVAPTISGNTFADNVVGVGVLGSYTYSYDYAASGVVAPSIDDNTFDTNGIDVLLAYAGFGAREFSPSVTNNNSTGPALHVGALPFLSGPGLAASAASSSPAKVPSDLRGRLRLMADNVLNHRMGANAPHKFTKRAASLRSGDAHTSGVVLPSTLSDITISGNTVTGAQFGGVFMYQYMYGGTGLDMQVDISNNQISSAGLGGVLVGAQITPEDTPIPDSISIQQNRISGAAEIGLAVDLSSCTCGPPPSSMNKALVVPEPANDVQIIGNILENGGTGLTIATDGYTSLAPLVSCNIIRNNTEAGAVIQDGSDPTPDFGGGTRLSPGKNSLHDNGGIDMENDDADPVKAENNWWGTTNLATIETNTLDFTEDNTRGDIDFDPPLAAEATDCIVSSGNADLAIAKTVTSTGPYVVGSNITYQLTVTNNGPDGANNVVITDPLPAGTSFVSASAGCSFASNTITCTAATLANGANTSFNITLQATMSGSVVNTATVDSDETDSTPGNSTATAPAVPVGALAATPIPTTSEWGLILMGLMMAAAGLWFTRRGV